MLKVEGLKLPYDYDGEMLKAAVCKKLHIRKSDIGEILLLKEALDARKKPHLAKVLSAGVSLCGDEEKALKAAKNGVSRYVEYRYRLPQNRYGQPQPPIVVGAGPAGLFAGLILAKAGLKPLIVEGGKPAPERTDDILSYCRSGELLPHSNIQFGEGGAGMFSDGKLTTGTKDPRHRFIINTLTECGADSSIGYAAKPHIGSDVLPAVSSSLRREIEKYGGSFMFSAVLKDITVENRSLKSIVIEREGKTEILPCTCLVLATGHSARNTVTTLYERGAEIERKPFSVGARIEHLQRDINRAQLGAENESITADYKLSCHLENGRSVYTFCMCPGGTVVPAASEPETTVTNGMSEFARASQNANSALLVSVRPEDFPYEGPLAGIRWQRELEHKAWILGNGLAPAQRVEDFLAGRKTAAWGKVSPSYAPGVTPADLNELFPTFIGESLKAALPLLDAKLAGFAEGDAVLTAIETRSSAPYRILRDEDGQCNIKGIFPAGEGSGYAGGIMSSAADGIRIAEKVLNFQ